MARARAEVWFTLKVAVLLHADTPRSEIARRLQVKPVEVSRAIERLTVIADEID